MVNLNFNVFNSIILAGIFHGFIFSFILFANKKLNSKTNHYLAFTILSLAFSNLQYWFIDTGVIPRALYENNNLLFIPFEFLMLPFFFLFIKSYINMEINKKERVLLFVPFALCVVYLFIEDLLKTETQIAKILNLTVEYISIIFSVTIIILVFRILIIYEKNYSEYNISDVVIETKWIKRILVLGLLLCVLWFGSLNIFESFLNKGYYKYYPLWIGMAILIYWMGYSAILQRHLFSERKEIRKRIVVDVEEKQNLLYKKKSPITYSKIESLIVNNRMYLNPSLSLGILSKELNMSEGYISQLINANTNINFNDYINKLRVEDVKQKLENKEYEHYTILAVGLESGFNSKSSFNSVFKKQTNLTPSEYKKLKSVQNL